MLPPTPLLDYSALLFILQLVREVSPRFFELFGSLSSCREFPLQSFDLLSAHLPSLHSNNCYTIVIRYRRQRRIAVTFRTNGSHRYAPAVIARKSPTTMDRALCGGTTLRLATLLTARRSLCPSSTQIPKAKTSARPKCMVW
jgi:hypothetical protein